jgi:hypothetical protein
LPSTHISPVFSWASALQGAAVDAAEVIALPAAAVEEDLVPAVQVADRGQPLGDLGYGGVEVDLLVLPIRRASQRGRQPVPSVLIVVQPQRLLTRVAGRGRVVLVAPDPPERPAVQLDLDAAVALAQDARRRMPLPGIGVGPLNGGSRPGGGRFSCHGSSTAIGAARAKKTRHTRWMPWTKTVVQATVRTLE